MPLLQEKDKGGGMMEDYKRLKSIPEHNYDNCHNVTCRRKCEKDGYNKAIDDFEQKLLEKAPRNYAGDLELGGSVSFLSANTVTKIAEQLKAGEVE